jgi:hypothetical protein
MGGGYKPACAWAILFFIIVTVRNAWAVYIISYRSSFVKSNEIRAIQDLELVDWAGLGRMTTY